MQLWNTMRKVWSYAEPQWVTAGITDGMDVPMDRLRSEKDEDLPIFRPRMGGGRRPKDRIGSTSLRNAVLANARRLRRASGAGSSVAGARLGAGARRVVVKAHLLRMNASGAKAAALHLRYIERDGVEKDGSKGVLYDAAGAVDGRAFEGARAGEKHQFRLIVSPEDGAELDLDGVRPAPHGHGGAGRRSQARVGGGQSPRHRSPARARGPSRRRPGRPRGATRSRLHLEWAAHARAGARDRGARPPPGERHPARTGQGGHAEPLYLARSRARATGKGPPGRDPLCGPTGTRRAVRARSPGLCISRGSGSPSASRPRRGDSPRAGSSRCAISVHAATSSSRSTPPSRAIRPATASCATATRCRPIPRAGRAWSPDGSRARDSPTSSRAASTPSSRRPRAGRTMSRSTREPRRRCGPATSCR